MHEIDVGIPIKALQPKAQDIFKDLSRAQPASEPQRIRSLRMISQ